MCILYEDALRCDTFFDKNGIHSRPPASMPFFLLSGAIANALPSANRMFKLVFPSTILYSLQCKDQIQGCSFLVLNLFLRIVLCSPSQ